MSTAERESEPRGLAAERFPLYSYNVDAGLGFLARRRCAMELSGSEKRATSIQHDHTALTRPADRLTKQYVGRVRRGV